jgi:hypothetical protein
MGNDQPESELAKNKRSSKREDSNMQKVVIAVGMLFAAAFIMASEKIGFDAMTVNEAPAAWTMDMTHTGGTPKWIILRDATAPSRPNVLAQISDDATKSRYPLAIYNGAKLVDGTIQVKFKTISGKVDQAAGLIWRYRDPDNYYLVRANALENNVVLYKVEGGNRTSLEPKGTPSKTYGVKHVVPSAIWGELSVKFRGNLFEVSFNGEKLFDVEDSTFQESGKIGLWTKADSVTYFDDFFVEPVGR